MVTRGTGMRALGAATAAELVLAEEKTVQVIR